MGNFVNTAPMSPTVCFAAAHADFPDSEPLGGGKTVADYLIREHPDWQVLSPARLGLRLDKPLAQLGEVAYARFCRQFERAATAAIRRQDPRRCVVLANDISEGPDFAALAQEGYRLVSIWHVDVVEYFTKFYLRGWIAPQRAAGWSRYDWLPDLLKLVFCKQAECVRHAARLIVPSAPMAERIRSCYPDCPAAKIVVIPWGNLASPATAGVPPLPVADDEVVIVTLSRLSPEKGIERLLAAEPWLTGRFQIWICGAAAYMQGRRYERKLRRLAGARVRFLGHVTGPVKAAVLARADILVSPSRHESYGLSIAEALAAGCRVVSHDHYGASGVVTNCADPRQLAETLNRLIAAGRTRKENCAPATATAAQRVAEVLAAV